MDLKILPNMKNIWIRTSFIVVQSTCAWLIVTLLISLGLPHTLFSTMARNLKDFPLWCFRAPTTWLRAWTPFIERRPFTIHYTQSQQIWNKIVKLRWRSIQYTNINIWIATEWRMQRRVMFCTFQVSFTWTWIWVTILNLGVVSLAIFSAILCGLIYYSF